MRRPGPTSRHFSVSPWQMGQKVGRSLRANRRLANGWTLVRDLTGTIPKLHAESLVSTGSRNSDAVQQSATDPTVSARSLGQQLQNGPIRICKEPRLTIVAGRQKTIR